VNPEMIDLIKEIFLGSEFPYNSPSHPDISLAKQEKRGTGIVDLRLLMRFSYRNRFENYRNYPENYRNHASSYRNIISLSVETARPEEYESVKDETSSDYQL